MPTPWTYPSTVSQYAEVPNHISWLHNNDEFENTELDLTTEVYKINQLRTAKDLLHISNPLSNDLKMKTHYLLFRGFNFLNLPATTTGIEVQVNVRRGGRIFDDTVQLYLNQPVGENKANKDLSNMKTYGGAGDMWDLASISPADPDFALQLRFQSHPEWPHKVTPNMVLVQMRVW